VAKTLTMIQFRFPRDTELIRLVRKEIAVLKLDYFISHIDGTDAEIMFNVMDITRKQEFILTAYALGVVAGYGVKKPFVYVQAGVTRPEWDHLVAVSNELKRTEEQLNQAISDRSLALASGAHDHREVMEAREALISQATRMENLATDLRIYRDSSMLFEKQRNEARKFAIQFLRELKEYRRLYGKLPIRLTWEWMKK
jgi:hypothetical protein